ncbi:serpin family protein [Methanoculleus sp. UBA303]|jgi:serpin B|uniref:serpin family protein n=1 Tax=Methanoculleus sp. UBA303 TaxID=1915497 RepID=UPI0025FB52FF|nr:serpin family protein [Methanoculleus sp. UBA303]MDD3933764.1 serpin family protein [Methanoculleus sp.]
MNRKGISILLLASLVALGCIAAGCTDMPGATSADPVPSAGEETADDPGNVTAGNNRFAFDLYHQLADDPESAGQNLFFSPYSISSALAITYEGARGTTADEIRSVLHLPANDTLRREGFAGIDASLNRGDANYTLRTANALWAEETYPFLPDYIETARRWYSANATNLDFKSSPEASRATINRWVEGQTEDKIRDLLPPGSIDSLTRLVITNAIYFKGTWVDQFDANETREEEFLVSPNETVLVPMMHREDAVYGYTETDTLQVLEMPYAHKSGTELSMLVLLPAGDNNLTAAEKVLDAETLADLRESLVRERVRVSFPKFTLETEYSLPGTLAAMGMSTVFTGAADLSGMDGTRNLFITGVFHKAFVDVNEEGTEAAAATGTVIGVTSARPDTTPVFKADHPFVFLITENDTGTILFVGRVTNPENS